ncbi:MAG: PrgI family protein [Patescibacteria group bacterium]
MQFKVPQFLEVEDKIFGPFTFKEFIYLAGGAGMCFVIYELLGLLLGLVPMLAVAGFSLTLTFYKPNNKPFIEMLEAGLRYGLQSKLYIWKRRQNKVNPNKTIEAAKKEKEVALSVSNPRLNKSKLRDLAWSLDVLDLSKHEINK